MDDAALQALINNYQPNEDVVQQASSIRLVATVGPSASGKTSVMRTLASSNPDFKLAIGETSRSLRPNEQGATDMVNRPKDEIVNDIKAGRLLQVVIGPSGDIYCTRPQDFPATGTGLFPLIPLGVRQFRALPLKFFAAAFIVPVSYELWQQWLTSQAKLSNWTDAQLAGRLAEARTSYEFALHDPQIKFVLNDDLTKAARRLMQVTQGHAPDDEALAHQTAQMNYHELITYVGHKS